MARRCDVCGKEPQLGYSVSHAHNKTRKLWYPNLHKVRLELKGSKKRVRVCTQCLRTSLSKSVS